jgi:hypothetical protein
MLTGTNRREIRTYRYTMEPSAELAFTRRPKGEISCRMDVLEFRSGSERNGESSQVISEHSQG